MNEVPDNIFQLAEFAQEELDRSECKESLLFFTSHFFKIRHGRNFVVNRHHQIICDALEKVLRGEITRLIINIAPRYGKTELAVKNFIAHGLALNPAAKFIHLTYAAKLALDNSEEAKDIVLDPEYQRLFDVEIKKDSQAKDKWYTTAGGGVYAAAAGGQVTGFGAGKVDEEEKKEEDEEKKKEAPETLDIDALEEFASDIEQKEGFGGAIIIDDPIKPEDGNSDTKRNRVNERFETTIRNRVNSRKTPIIVIQQRVHTNDLSGYLMDVEPGEWTVIKLPCLQPDGTALWEMKHTIEELKHLQRINTYVFESQYQQDPKPLRRGGEFYKLFSLKKNVIPNKKAGRYPYLYNPELPIHLTFDFNVNPYMTCCIWQIIGKRAIQVDEITLESPRNTTVETCREFKSRYPDHRGGIFIYGDPSGRKEDTRTEKGQNDYTIIMREMFEYRPSLRVEEKAPPAVVRGNWINAVFAENLDGLEFLIGDNCTKTLEDYQFGKEDSDGTKLKEKVKDPVTGVTYEKYHHCTDANDYFQCRAFIKEFSLYQKGGKKTEFKTGKSVSKKIY